jgi:hypothetical protein
MKFFKFIFSIFDVSISFFSRRQAEEICPLKKRLLEIESLYDEVSSLNTRNDSLVNAYAINMYNDPVEKQIKDMMDEISKKLKGVEKKIKRKCVELNRMMHDTHMELSTGNDSVDKFLRHHLLYDRIQVEKMINFIEKISANTKQETVPA